jgi:hypothetical protein
MSVAVIKARSGLSFSRIRFNNLDSFSDIHGLPLSALTLSNARSIVLFIISLHHYYWNFNTIRQITTIYIKGDDI